MTRKMRRYLLLLTAVLALMIGSAISVHADQTCQQTKGTPTTVTLSWDAVSGANRYVVSVGGTSKTVTTTTCKVTGLKQATQYRATVTCYTSSNANLGSYSLNVFTTVGKLTTVKPYSWNTNGTGGTFTMTSNPYAGYLDGYQWKITVRCGNS